MFSKLWTEKCFEGPCYSALKIPEIIGAMFTGIANVEAILHQKSQLPLDVVLKHILYLSISCTISTEDSEANRCGTRPKMRTVNLTEREESQVYS